MAVFKDFFHKMIYGFSALFLLSFTIGAMEASDDDNSLSDTPSSPLIYTETEEMIGGAKPKLEIEIKPITFQNTLFYTRGVFDSTELLPHIKELPKVLTHSFTEMKNSGCGAYSEFKSNGKNKHWYDFRSYLLDTPNTCKRRIAGEVAAEIFFGHLGYIPLPLSDYKGFQS